MSLTGRDITRNQAAFDLDLSVLCLGDNKYLADETYLNTSGALETVAFGQVMGVISASGKWAPFKSGNADGTEVPRAVFIDELTDVAIAGEVEGVNLVNGGMIDQSKLVFDGADDLDTVVGGVSVRNSLIANSQGLRLKTVSDNTSFDN